MPDETRIFDVARPGKAQPPATSRPIIVGHQPAVSDPMVKDDRIPVQYDEPAGPAHIDVMEHSAEPPVEPRPDEPGLGSDPEPDRSPFRHDPEPADHHEPSWPEAPAADDIPPPSHDYQDHPAEAPHVAALDLQSPRRRRRWPKIGLALLVLAVAAYLAIDSGLIKTNLNLPVHIFKQKIATPATASTSSAAKTPAIPVGFTDYKLSGTQLSFAAPSAWGHPTSATDPGYTSRGGTNQSSGNYAYMVTFDTNKDIQLVVTSSKYLPPVRTALYYDYLGWCTGTNDDKYYLSVLRYSTDSNKIDTPSTITCDQGPLIDVTKIDSTTIAQLNAKTADGKSAGDLYTKNLNKADLPVIRVKDAASTNGDNIKKLLNTIQFASQ